MLLERHCLSHVPVGDEISTLMLSICVSFSVGLLDAENVRFLQLDFWSNSFRAPLEVCHHLFELEQGGGYQKHVVGESQVGDAIHFSSPSLISISLLSTSSNRPPSQMEVPSCITRSSRSLPVSTPFHLELVTLGVCTDGGTPVRVQLLHKVDVWRVDFKSRERAFHIASWCFVTNDFSKSTVATTCWQPILCFPFEQSVCHQVILGLKIALESCLVEGLEFVCLLQSLVLKTLCTTSTVCILDGV